MKKLTLTNHVQRETTVLENEFIDHYMAKANGEYVKVYLLLLRHLNAPSGTLTISRIADLLDHTEKDVIRALNYWKKQGLLEYEDTASRKAASAKGSGSARRRVSETETASRRMSETEAGSRRMSEAETGSRRMSEAETASRRDSGTDTGSRRMSETEEGLRRDPGAETGPRRMAEAETGLRRMAEAESGSRRMSEAETAPRRISDTESVPQRMSGAETAPRRMSGAESSSSAHMQEAPVAQRHQRTESDAHPDAASLRDLFARKEAFLSEDYEPLPPVPEVSNLQQYKSRKEFKELLFVAEQYLGKTLSSTDIETIAYFYETLHMSLDLTEYLIEYCVENGHKSMHYIRKVALSWHERGISTVAEAKAGSLSYNRNCYSVLNAFGIKGRSPAASELTYIKKWTEEYGFSLEIIVEACNKTISTIHQPSFDYADTILRDWLSKKVQRLEDIKAIDAGFLKEKERRKKQTSKASASRNKFNNFEGRSYDMNELERKLIQQ